MYEKILVPLDGSELSEIALPYAEDLSEKLGSEIILLHVCEPPGSECFHIHQLYIERLSEITKEHLEGRTKVEPLVLPGNPAEEIIDYAEGNNIGLITMATHGRSGVKRWMLGSIVNKVVRETTKPILLIRAKGVRPPIPEKRMLNKLLVPLDGSKASKVILPYIEELTSKLKPEVTLLQVIASAHYDVPMGETVAAVPYSEKEIEELKAATRAYLEKAGSGLKNKRVTVRLEVAVGTGAEVTVGTAAKEIVEFADKINADLIAMSTHGSSGFSRLFFGSVADRVLHTGNTPLLLVKPLEAAMETQ